MKEPTKYFLFSLVLTFIIHFVDHSTALEAPTVTPVSNRFELERRILFTIFTGYNKDIRPPGNNATVVSLNVWIRNLLSVAEHEHTWLVDLTLRREWNDPRLKYSTEGFPDYKFLTLANSDKLWLPNVFLPLELQTEPHNVPHRSELIRIYPNGDVMFSVRITSNLYCAKPSDTSPGELNCALSFSSYAYISDDVMWTWKNSNQVEFSQTYLNDDFTVGGYTVSTADRVTATGRHATAYARITLLRNQCRASTKGPSSVFGGGRAMANAWGHSKDFNDLF